MNKHTACDFKNCSFDNNQGKHDFYRDSEVMHATEKINFEKNQMLLLTEKQEKKYCKAQDRCHYTGKYCGTANSICNARYKTPTEIPALFHHGFNYDYHFIIKELAEEF